MAARGSMATAAKELFGEELDIVLPRLMNELHAPHRAAATLGAAPNSVRKWLLRRGWRFVDGQWVAPSQEAEHAPSL